MNILVSGASGRMGKEVISCIEKDNDLNFICGFGQNEKLYLGKIPIYNNISKIKERPDVIIDFSNVRATFEMLNFAKNKHLPIVIATTGFNHEQEKIIKDYSKDIPIFKSANMSFDINLMCKIVARHRSTI